MSSLKVHSLYPESSYMCECLIVGSGAGGSVAAERLSAAGFDTIVLEEGAYYSTETFKRPGSELLPKLYRNGGAIPFIGSPMIGFSEGRVLGGGTVVNGGIFSPPPEDILNHWFNDLQLNDLSPTAFRRHIHRIEKDLGIAREEVGLGNNDSRLLAEAAKKMNWPFEISQRTMINCKNTNRCPTGCPTGAKQSTDQNLLLRAAKNGARLFTNARVIKINAQAQHAHSVEFVDAAGKVIKVYFKTLFMAAGPIQSPYLLRKSGVAVKAGKQIRFHLPLKIITKFHDDIFAQNGTASKVVVNVPGKKGFKIAPSNMRPEFMAISLAAVGESFLNQALKDINKIAIYMALLNPKSYAQLFTAKFAQPIVTSCFQRDDIPDIIEALRLSTSLLLEAGASELYLPLIGSKPVTSLKSCESILRHFNHRHLDLMTVHASSSCAMGVDPKTSIINPAGLVWNWKNIFVVDASALPSAPGVGPQASIMALADQISERFISESRSL